MGRFLVARSAVLIRAALAGALLTAVAAPAAVADPPVPPPCTHDRHADPAAGGEWSTMSGDLAGTRYQADETTIGPDNAGDLVVDWAVKVGTGGATGSINSTPTVLNGCVFVANTLGTPERDTGLRVSAIDLATGDVVWFTDYDLHLKADGTPAAAGLGGPAVSAVVVDDDRVFTLVNEVATGADDGTGPFAVAMDLATGAKLWESEPFDTFAATYTNASPVVIPSDHGSVLFAGWSPPEGHSLGQGGFVLLDPDTGEVVKKTFTIPEADQADLDGDGAPDNAGGGIWAPLSYADGYAYIGAGNTFSKQTEHPHTNSILKIDVRDRHDDTFGTIIGAAKGNIDQYHEGLEALRTTEACDASDLEGFAWPLDDPVCGQLDLDFGAPVNVFEHNGQTLVAGLQKAGVVHVFDADTLVKVWETEVGLPCAPCNAAATAVDPANGIAGVSAPGGTAFMLGFDGAIKWALPIGDGSHYNGVSAANGVVYTTDNFGTLNVIDAATGAPIARRPMAADIASPAVAFSSSGLAIAGNRVIVGLSGGAPPAQDGWVVAYKLP
jgi:hypothetical protein